MKCPICHLENPPTAELCDCGYSFAKRIQIRPAGIDRAELVELRSIARSVRSIRTMVLFWTFVMIASGILVAFQINQFEEKLKDIKNQVSPTEQRR